MKVFPKILCVLIVVVLVFSVLNVTLGYQIKTDSISDYSVSYYDVKVQHSLDTYKNELKARNYDDLKIGKYMFYKMGLIDFNLEFFPEEIILQNLDVTESKLEIKKLSNFDNEITNITLYRKTKVNDGGIREAFIISSYVGMTNNIKDINNISIISDKIDFYIKYNEYCFMSYCYEHQFPKKNKQYKFTMNCEEDRLKLIQEGSKVYSLFFKIPQNTLNENYSYFEFFTQKTGVVLNSKNTDINDLHVLTNFSNRDIKLVTKMI